MNIIQFLDEVGHTKLQFQLLHDCIKGAKQCRGHVEVRFGTNEIAPGDLIGQPRRVGVVVWMDKAEYDRAKAAARSTT